MNYGLVSAALANKITLARLDELSQHSGVRIHPIIGNTAIKLSRSALLIAYFFPAFMEGQLDRPPRFSLSPWDIRPERPG
ncbi:MAG: phosphoenolpyruvate carboxylase [Candidatus Electrothrix sp. YB6]